MITINQGSTWHFSISKQCFNCVYAIHIRLSEFLHVLGILLRHFVKDNAGRSPAIFLQGSGELICAATTAVELIFIKTPTNVCFGIIFYRAEFSKISHFLYNPPSHHAHLYSDLKDFGMAYFSVILTHIRSEFY